MPFIIALVFMIVAFPSTTYANGSCPTPEQILASLAAQKSRFENNIEPYISDQYWKITKPRVLKPQRTCQKPTFFAQLMCLAENSSIKLVHVPLGSDGGLCKYQAYLQRVSGVYGEFTLEPAKAGFVSLDGYLYKNCEQGFRWMANNRLGEGSHGSVYTACRGSDCNFVAKVATKDLRDHHNETRILSVLKEQDVAPAFHESFTCQRMAKRKTSGRLIADDVGVIIMDKLDGTLDDLLASFFRKALVKKFGSLKGAREYFYDGLIAVKLPALAEEEDGIIKEHVLKDLSLGQLNWRMLMGKSPLFGKDPSKHFRIEPIPEELTGILADVDKLLIKAASLSIIHRDLKPDNVMYKNLPDGSKKFLLIDFGKSLHADIVETHGRADTYLSTLRVLGAPQAPGENENECFDKISLELEMYMQYGITYTFTTTQQCRDFILKNYDLRRLFM